MEFKLAHTIHEQEDAVELLQDWKENVGELVDLTLAVSAHWTTSTKAFLQFRSENLA